MSDIRLTKREAREFLLGAHFLTGSKLKGGQRAVNRVLNRLMAVQVDSISVAGTNHDIAFNSRVSGYSPKVLDKVLYEKRTAFEYWLKCLCILPRTSKLYHEFRMRRALDHFEGILSEHKTTSESVLRQIREKGPQSPSDFSDDRRTRGGWTGSQRLVKRLLEVFFDCGVLMIHHRNGRMRYYDLAERCIPPADRHTSEKEYQRTAVLDIYRAMRMFPPTGGPGVSHFTREFRKTVHQDLVEDETVERISIDGCKQDYFILAEDKKLLDGKPRSGTAKPVRFLAPLDSLLWDRKLVSDVFGFDPIFEVYKPPNKRRYGYYCLPILYGRDLVGRLDIGKNGKEKSMNVISVHWEPGFPVKSGFLKALADELIDYRRFLGMERIRMPGPDFDGRKRLEGLVC